MLRWLLLAQLASAETAYSTPALQAFVEAASRMNRRVPAGLVSYRASVESELAFLARRADGPEGAIAIEQVQNDVRWRLPGEFEQHVIGYRSQTLGLSLSALSFIRQPWAVPMLYGNRISLLLGRDTTRAGMRGARARRFTAVHPLAEDRDRTYRFSGGDTVIAMRIGDRDLPIVRVMVAPRADVPPRTVAFSGELDIDATRHSLVRMRGHFVVTRPVRSLVQRALSAGGIEAIAFMELENGEFEGQYWLPTYQRYEAQAAWMATSDSRSVFRMVSRFHGHRVNDTTLVVAQDTLLLLPFRLSFARSDSIARFRQWRLDIGDQTSRVHSGDFDDVAPDRWRPTGPPRTSFRVRRLSDAFHANRIEGAYTGWGVEQRFRDHAPGLILRAGAGWAWSEQTVRGSASAERSSGPWTWTARLGRGLDITNDFRSTFDSGSVLAALVQDNYDYVDRRLAAVGIARRLDRAQSVIRLEGGPASDAPVARTMARPVFRGDSGFRENRGVRRGRYWRQLASIEWRPDVSAEFLRTGLGGYLGAEHAFGDLDFTRIDARLVARQNRGRLTVALRLDAGSVLGDSVPPQQLYELGRNTSLQGYSYKEFVGNHAAIARGLVMYRLGILESPMRLVRWFVPGVSPALAASAQGAWTELRGAGAEAANAELWLPLRSESDGIRSSVTLGMRFFGGAVGVGAARPMDRAGRWRLRVEFGQLF